MTTAMANIIMNIIMTIIAIEWRSSYTIYGHDHDHHHDHDHEHGHDHNRAKAMPTDKWVPHTHEPGVPHEHGVNDYMKPLLSIVKHGLQKQDVIEQTPDPAVREMILRMEQIGCDTVFDRFDKTTTTMYIWYCRRMLPNLLHGSM